MLANSKPSKTLASFLEKNSFTLNAILSNDVVLAERHFTDDYSAIYVCHLKQVKGYKVKRWTHVKELSPMMKEWLVAITEVDNCE